MQAISNGAYFPARFRSWIYFVQGWRALMTKRYLPYRPERHYMRGPGPKSREKHQRCSV